MPRIQAPTVAEHHARQRRALLDAARAILAESGDEPTMRDVAERVGLARSSVYQYFASAEELLAAVVADAFPAWADQVLDTVSRAPTPGEKVWAYIEANLEMFASTERAVAAALTRVVDPQVLRGPMQDFHARLQAPLTDALHDLGEPEPDAIAKHVNSLIMQESHGLDEPDPHARAVLHAQALDRLSRLLGGYLSLPSRRARTR